MTQLEPAFQKFRSKNGTPLASLLCHVCAETQTQYVLWTDIQTALEGVSYLWIAKVGIVIFTIDNGGELWQPLRVAHVPDAAYTVIHKRQRKRRAKEPCYIRQENNESPVIGPKVDNDQIQGIVKNQMDYDFFSSLEEMYKLLVEVHYNLRYSYKSERATFLQCMVNTRYYHSAIVEEMKKLNEAGVRARVGRLDQEQLLENLGSSERQLPEWDYWNVCESTLHEERHLWGYVPSTLYIALPLDPHSWDDSNPSTYQFRLYFLCENWKHESAPEDFPQHLHLSNHPGYNIKRPYEFFQVYGYYILRILHMVKCGYSNDRYEIPSLDKILWNCDPDIIGSHLTTDTLGPLIDKTIGYLQDLALPKRIMQVIPTRQETVAIINFLDTYEGDNGQSNLSRCVTSSQIVFWMCQSHMHRLLDQGALEDLKAFVVGEGGHVDMSNSTIKVNLRSSVKADQFRAVLMAVKHVFDVSIKLDWQATRSYAKSFFLDIAKTGTAALEIDGITLDINPQGHVRYISNLFSDVVIEQTQLQFVTLLNYPRPQVQCIQFRCCSLQSQLSPPRLTHRWVDLREDLERFLELVSTAQVVSDHITAARDLQAVLENHGLSDVTVVTIYNGLWDAVFDLEKSAFVEAFSWNSAYPKALVSLGSLRKMTVWFDCQKFEQEFFRPDPGQPLTTGTQYLLSRI